MAKKIYENSRLIALGIYLKKCHFQIQVIEYILQLLFFLRLTL